MAILKLHQDVSEALTHHHDEQLVDLLPQLAEECLGLVAPVSSMPRQGVEWLLWPLYIHVKTTTHGYRQRQNI
jgi:hypothetical protein